MTDSRKRVEKICACSLVGALYAVLTVLLAPISYGPVQCRVSEVLCVLPYFAPVTGWGLTLGCALANLLTGNVMDVVFGSAATLLAALCTAWFGKREHSGKNAFLACLMPVVFNGLIVGGVITSAYNGLNIFGHMGTYLLTVLWIALGEAVVMLIFGSAAIRMLPRYEFFRNMINRIK